MQNFRRVGENYGPIFSRQRIKVPDDVGNPSCFQRCFPIVYIMFLARDIGLQSCHSVVKLAKIGSFWAPEFLGDRYPKYFFVVFYCQPIQEERGILHTECLFTDARSTLSIQAQHLLLSIVSRNATNSAV